MIGGWGARKYEITNTDVNQKHFVVEITKGVIIQDSQNTSDRSKLGGWLGGGESEFKTENTMIQN